MSLPILPSLGEKLKKGEKELIRTVLKCPNCKNELVREYIEGDFVFDTSKQKCSECDQFMVIDRIYSEIIKK
ncbi:MAG: hypothetical protein ACTSRA_08365 [Promethearchaeota archaeon]